MAKKKSEKVADPFAVLNKSTEVKKAAKKSTTPEATDKNLDEAIKSWIEAKKQAKESDTKLKKAEAAILPVAAKLKAEHCQKVGSYESSIKLNGKIRVSSQNKYSAIDMDEEDTLTEQFEDDYDRFFRTQTSVAFSAKLMADEKLLGEVLAKIQEAMTPEEFHDNFIVKRTLVPTEAFHHSSVCNPEVAAKADELKEAGIIKPNKPSIVAL